MEDEAKCRGDKFNTVHGGDVGGEGRNDNEGDDIYHNDKGKDTVTVNDTIEDKSLISGILVDTADNDKDVNISNEGTGDITNDDFKKDDGNTATTTLIDMEPSSDETSTTTINNHTHPPSPPNPPITQPPSTTPPSKLTTNSASSHSKATTPSPPSNTTSHPTTPPSTPIKSTKNLTNEKSPNEDDVLTSRLREVFDVCDNQSQGFISVDHFLDLAKEFASSDGHSDEKFIKRMVAALDSDGSGRISFEDFCKGVKQILLSNKSVLENGDIDQKVIQDFLIVRRQSVDGTRSPEIFETPPTPGVLALNKNNNNNNNSNNNSNNKNPFEFFVGDKAASNSSEDDVDSGAWSTVTQDNFWLSSTPSSSRHATLETTPSSLSNGFPGNDLLANGFPDNAGFPSNGIYDNGDFEDRGTNYFHRKVHSNNTTPRSSFRSSPGSRPGSFRKTVTASSIASQSSRSGSTMNCSESLLDVADCQVSELNDKILKLEDNLTSLNEIQRQNEDKQLKMKEENVLMVERVHVLEDQLREIEAMNNERIKEEQHKHREILIKTERDTANQIELLSRSLKLVEGEYNALKETTPTLRAENEKLKKQNYSLEQEMARMRQEHSDLNDEKCTLQETFAAEQARMVKERQARTQLLDDLTQELNELRICKSNLLRASPAFSRNDSDLDFQHTQERVKQLKKENSSLKGQLEELQAVVLSRGVQEGQRLLQHTSPFGRSLASEIDEIPKNELVAALKKEKEANAQLKEYIGFITLRILETNPSLLEINSPQEHKD